MADPARNYENIRIYGGMSSGVYLGPIGTTLPTTTLVVDPALESVGWLSEDGISLAVDANVEKFRGYPGGGVLRTKVTQSDKSVTIQALEESPLVLSLFFDAGTPTSVGTAGSELAKVVLPEMIGTVRRSGVLAFEDSGVQKFIVCPELQVTTRGTVAHKTNEMTVYEMGLEIIGEAYILTNDPNFLEAAGVVVP